MFRRAFLTAAACLFATQVLATQVVIASCPWSVPSDWNSSSNTIEAIGGGGGGAQGTSASGGQTGAAGGAGSYVKSINVSLTPSGTMQCQIGVAGVGTTALPTVGTDTIFNDTHTTCATVSGGSCAQGGQAAANQYTGGAGGASASSICTGVSCVKNSGGAGGAAVHFGGPAGGGGGAGGPIGNGFAGGASTGGGTWGGNGGGGSNGGSGSAGGNSVGTTGATGGNGTGGAGGGTGGTASSGGAGGNGTAGDGAGGGGGGEGTSGVNGGAGGSGSEQSLWSSTGPGGGGASGGGTSGIGVVGAAGAGSACGGGGAGGEYFNATSNGGAGGAGCLVATYTPASGGAPHNSLLMGIGFDPERDRLPIEPINLRLRASTGSSPGVIPSLTGGTIYGSTPAVTNAAMHRAGSASVATVANSGGAPTSCNITAGDSAGNYQCVVTGGQIEIEYTSTGATNLNGSSRLATETLTVTATNGTGTSAGVSVTVNAYADGALQAAGASQQNSALLSGYSHRPPWLVPTVDYAIGAPTSGLTPCASISQSGVTVSGKNVTVTGASVTLDHIDFTTNECSIVDNTNNGTLIISNSKLGSVDPSNVGYVVHVQTTNFTLTLTNDTLFPCTNNGGSNAVNCVGFQASGTVTFEYNDFEQGDQHPFEQVSGVTTVVYKWNLFENFCTVSGCHDNWLQWGAIGSGSTTDVEFNLGYTNQLFPGIVAGEGFQFYANNSGSLTTAVHANNTLIATGSNVQSNIIHGGTVGTGTDSANYFDATGTSGLPLPGGAYYPSSMVANGWTTSGDINMNTGATITPN